MPAPIIAAGLSLLSQGVNAGFNALNNSASRRWNESMYARQRADALADWNMQNEYNSPKNQMARLKEAGINPRLAYTSGVENAGSVVRSTNMEPWRPQAPQFDIGNSLGQFQDVEIKQAQLDNLKAQNELITMQSLWTNYKAQKEGTELQTAMFDDGTNMFQALKQTQLTIAKEQLRKLRTDTQVLLNRDEREALSNSQSLREGLERILTLRQGRQLSQAQQENINRDIDLKNLDIKLRKQWNLSPSDPLWIRLITPFLEKFGLHP